MVYDRVLSEKEIRALFERHHIQAGALMGPKESPLENPEEKTGDQPSSENNQKAIDALVKRAMKSAGLSSLGVALIRKGKPSAISVQGKHGGSSLHGSDPFVIASCSKAFTATLAAILVSNGQIRWDTTLAECFGDSIKKMHPKFRDVTLSQLLHHQGGAPERDRFWGSSELREAIRSPGSPTRQRRKLVELVTSEQPDCQPGEKVVYSNAGYYMAAAMMEEATGKTWESLLSDHILRPLKMDSSSPSSQIDAPLTMPAGGISASMADLATFFSIHMDFEKASQLGISKEAFDEIHTPSEASEFAKGFIVVRRPWSSGPVLTHLGMNREFVTVFWLAPAEGFGVVASTWKAGSNAEADLDKAVWDVISAAHPGLNPSFP